MNRIINFRAKRIDTGEWVYGFYISIAGTHKILSANADSASGATYYDVDASTVGQFTGLLDVNCNGIYEGDILRNGNNAYRVKYNNDLACWIAAYDWPDSVGNWQLSKEHCLQNHVIGNIYDNPKM